MLSQKDTIVESVIEKFKKRSAVGLQKYGTTLDREDLTMLNWLDHAQEEHMDAILYLEKMRKIEYEREKNEKKVVEKNTEDEPKDEPKDETDANNHEYVLLFPDAQLLNDDIINQNKELKVVLSFCIIPIILFILKCYVK